MQSQISMQKVCYIIFSTLPAGFHECTQKETGTVKRWLHLGIPREGKTYKTTQCTTGVIKLLFARQSVSFGFIFGGRVHYAAYMHMEFTMDPLYDF